VARKVKSTLTYSTELITPRFADDVLTNHNTKNRNISDSLSTRYADAMLRGEWEETGDPLRFNCDGTLADGQHRLDAIRKCGMSLPMLVVRGLPKTAFHKIDGGWKRTIGHHLAVAGEVNYNSLASAIRWFGVVDKRKSWKAAGVTSSQALATLKKHPKLRESVAFVLASGAKKVMSASLLSACHFCFSLKDADAANLFVEQLASGENLKRTDPVYVLRERLRRDKADRDKRIPDDCIAVFVIKAWNATRKGEVIKNLVWKSDEAFPLVQ